MPRLYLDYSIFAHDIRNIPAYLLLLSIVKWLVVIFEHGVNAFLALCAYTLNKPAARINGAAGFVKSYSVGHHSSVKGAISAEMMSGYLHSKVFLSKSPKFSPPPTKALLSHQQMGMPAL